MNKIFAVIIPCNTPVADDDALHLIGAETEAEASKLAVPLIPNNCSIKEIVELPGITAITGLICTYCFASLTLENTGEASN